MVKRTLAVLTVGFMCSVGIAEAHITRIEVLKVDSVPAAPVNGEAAPAYERISGKFYGELEVWRAIGEGLPAVIVNPSTILGVGDWNESSCAIFKSIYNEFPWYSNGINGFVDVSDVAKAIVSLMESDITGQRFILNGDNWTFRQLFNTIADGFGKKHPHREATPFLSAIAWRLEKIKSMFSGKRPLLTRESARVARSKTYFDNGKILKHLPDFQFTPLEKTIERSCEAYKLLWNSA